jgi:hypothetical protein
MATMTAREILRAEYGDSKNFMTPEVLKVGKIDQGTAYEISSGSGFDPGTTIYGVSIVGVREDGSTYRSDASKMFDSLVDARAYIRDLTFHFRSA